MIIKADVRSISNGAYMSAHTASHTTGTPTDLFQYISNYTSYATIVVDNHSSASKYCVKILSFLKDRDKISQSVSFNRYSSSEVYLRPVDYYIFALKKIVI